jgi:phosphoserine phosphatase
MTQYVLVNVTGPNQSGIIAELMKILTTHHSSIKDIGQAVTHGQLSLSFLLNQETEDVISELASISKKMGLTLSTKVIKDENSIAIPSEKYILSCVATKKITTDFLYEITALFSQYKINIHRIESLPQTSFRAMEVAANSMEEAPLEKIKLALMEVSNRHGIDMAFMKDDAFRFNKRLIVFDMDSTLIQAEVIDEMAAVHGIGDKVKLITERAMNGELNFDEALKERVALLKGLSREKMEAIFDKLPLTPGTELFIRTVKSLGFKTAIVSGGFRYFAENLKNKLGIDYSFANDLEFDGDLLTGKVKGQIINAHQKAFILELLAQQEHIHLEQVVAVGDGANDLPMLAKAGLGIAFHAKEKVRKEARHQMSHGPMTTILYFLGIPGNHLE